MLLHYFNISPFLPSPPPPLFLSSSSSFHLLLPATPPPSWCQVLGEYSHLVDALSRGRVAELLVGVLERPAVTSETRTWVLAAVAKLVGEGPSGSDSGSGSGSGAGESEEAELLQRVAQQHSSSLDTLLRQQALELLLLARDPQLQARVLPRGAAGAGLEVGDAAAPHLSTPVQSAPEHT